MAAALGTLGGLALPLETSRTLTESSISQFITYSYSAQWNLVSSTPSTTETMTANKNVYELCVNYVCEDFTGDFTDAYGAASQWAWELCFFHGLCSQPGELTLVASTAISQITLYSLVFTTTSEPVQVLSRTTILTTPTITSTGAAYYSLGISEKDFTNIAIIVILGAAALAIIIAYPKKPSRSASQDTSWKKAKGSTNGDIVIRKSSTQK